MSDCVFKIANPSVKEVGRSARCSRSKIILLKQSDFVSSCNSVKSYHRACATTPNYSDIILRRMQATKQVLLRYKRFLWMHKDIDFRSGGLLKWYSEWFVYSMWWIEIEYRWIIWWCGYWSNKRIHTIPRLSNYSLQHIYSNILI